MGRPMLVVLGAGLGFFLPKKESHVSTDNPSEQTQPHHTVELLRHPLMCSSNGS